MRGAIAMHTLSREVRSPLLAAYLFSCSYIDGELVFKCR